MVFQRSSSRYSCSTVIGSVGDGSAESGGVGNEKKAVMGKNCLLRRVVRYFAESDGALDDSHDGNGCEAESDIVIEALR
jgi:hypothetical protein